MSLRPVSVNLAEAEPGPLLLWIHGWARQVERAALHAHIGPPLHVVTDSARTFGGDEDWWLYQVPSGETVAICLRVPYLDAVLYSSVETFQGVKELAALLSPPWAVEIFEKPYPR